MDKYQKFIFEQSRDEFFVNNCISVKTGQICKTDFDEETDTFTIFQDRDIFSTVYCFCFSGYIAHLYVTKGDTDWIEILRNEATKDDKNAEKQYRVKLDFEDRITQIKFIFKDNLANPYVLKIEYKEADKESYFKEQDQKKRGEYIEKAAISVRTGCNLVNIFFQPCDKSYSQTEIDLFLGPDNSYCFSKCAADGETYFISVPNLAEGDYCFKLRQLDSLKQIIFESDLIKFKIISFSDPVPIGWTNVI